MVNTIYKVCGRDAWEAARAEGAYSGSVDDQRDGFIHFSTWPQLETTLQKHFSGRDDLLLIAVDPARLGDALKWEPSRGGDLFPHLYAPLPMEAVLNENPLPLAADGMHRLPDGAGP